MTKTRKGLFFCFVFFLLFSGVFYFSLWTDSRAILSLLSVKSSVGIRPASLLEIILRRPRSHHVRKDPVLIESKVGTVFFPHWQSSFSKQGGWLQIADDLVAWELENILLLPNWNILVNIYWLFHPQKNKSLAQ